MERIVISELGVLKDLELDIKDFLVFTGNNVRGKSTLAKIIYFFKSFRVELIRFIKDALWNREAKLNISAFNRIMRNKFLKLFGPTFGLKRIEVKYYFNNNYAITVGLKGKYVDFTFHESFKEEVFDYFIIKVKKFFKELAELKKNDQEVNIKEEKNKFLKIVTNEINEIFGENRDVFYIPSTRLALTATNIPSRELLEKNNYLLFELYEYIQRVKKNFTKSLEELEQHKKEMTDTEIKSDFVQLARQYVNELFKARLVVDKTGEKIFYSDERYVRLNFASLSQQSLVWLIHLIYLWILENKNLFVVIEEPELGLIAEDQKILLQLIALLANSGKNQIVLTTHSPYMLFGISNLLQASSLSNEHPEEEVEKIISKKLWIANDNFKALEFSKNQISELFDSGIYMGYEFIENFAEAFNEEYKELFKLT